MAMKNEPPKSRRITLDTNVANFVADPDLTPRHREGCKQLRAAIKSGHVQAFVSEASVFVECLGFAEKLAYLAVAGTEDPRPAPDARRVVVFDKLARLGVRLLHAPLIGAERFITMPWADDDVHPREERVDRFGAFCRQYPMHKPIVDFGSQLLTQQEPLPPPKAVETENGRKFELRQGWAVAIKRAWDRGDETARKTLRNTVGPMISEWSDVLILGSHYAYGLDIFCTVDEGSNAGTASVMHPNSRSGLSDYGIQFSSPEACH